MARVVRSVQARHDGQPQVAAAPLRALPERCGEDGLDPEVWRGDGEVNISWQDLTLTDGHYRCPRCDAFALSFRQGGMRWD